MTFLKSIYLPLLLHLLLFILRIQCKECDSDKECTKVWSTSYCKSGKCSCRDNYIRRRSSNKAGWTCLSLMDANTGMIGPPATCPYPEGTGYQFILQGDLPTAVGKAVFCSTKKGIGCPVAGYECIQVISLFVRDKTFDGICCPGKDIICSQRRQSFADVEDDEDGWLQRWHYIGDDCRSFKWNPEIKSTANIFITKEECLSTCLGL